MCKIRPIKCGCGGEAHPVITILYDTPTLYRMLCSGCGISTSVFDSEEEAVNAWNKAMSGKDPNILTKSKSKAKAIEHKVSIIADDGLKYDRSEYLCSNCKKKIFGDDDYCANCGCELDWTEL